MTDNALPATAALAADTPTRVSFFTQYRKPLLGALAVVMFFVVWQVIYAFVPLNTLFMSKPSLIFAGLSVDIDSGLLFSDLVVSGKPLLIGFGAAVVVGVFVGTMMGWRKRVGYALDPLMTALYSSPLVAVAPLMIIAFGVGVTGKAILIFILCVFPFLFNTYAGVKAVDQILVNVVRSFGGGQRDIYLKIIVPSVLPYIVTAARYGVGRALVAVLVGEFYAATAGIGYRIAWYSAMFQISRMFGYILVMMVIAVAFTEGIRWAERTAFPWRIGM